MGLGGHLLWTAAIRNLEDARGGEWAVVGMPKFTDLLRGRLYAGDRTFRDDPVFGMHPRILHLSNFRKPKFEKIWDRRFHRWIEKCGLGILYEKLIVFLCRLLDKRYVHVDARIHHYIAEEKEDRYIWKNHSHIIDCLLEHFKVASSSVHRPEMHFSKEEEEWGRQWLEEQGLVPGNYGVVEPHTKEDWFGKLRSWPWERWCSLFDRLLQPGPKVWIQVGLGDKPVLPGLRDMTGKLSFRQTALVIRQAGLFVGTEGGLMHVAAAVDTPAVIIYGGITKPDFSGYPESHHIVCNHVGCIHCGYKGCCPNEHVCMNSISPEQVAGTIQEAWPTR